MGITACHIHMCLGNTKDSMKDVTLWKMKNTRYEHAFQKLKKIQKKLVRLFEKTTDLCVQIAEAMKIDRDTAWKMLHEDHNII